MLRLNDVSGLRKYLTKNNCNKVIHGESLLSWAVRMGNVGFTNLLIDRGADINKTDSIGRTYLHTHNVIGRENMYQTLLASRKRGFIDQNIEIYPYSFTQKGIQENRNRVSRLLDYKKGKYPC